MKNLKKLLTVLLTALLLSVAVATPASASSYNDTAIGKEVEWQIRNNDDVNSIEDITELCVNDQKITSLKDLEKMPNLEELNLINCKLEDNIFSANTFKNNTYLSYICLLDNNLTTLPMGIFNSLDLIYLDLDYNNISKFPDNFFSESEELQYLFISNNNITSLPNGIFDNNRNLCYLDLSNNYLEELPAGIFDKLENLSSLFLFSNCLEELPANIFDRLQLLELNLDNNYLGELPTGIFDKLTTLDVLSLGGNNIVLPSGIFDKLENLTCLDLADCGLTQINPVIFKKLTNLEMLYLSNNDFSSATALPVGIFNDLSALNFIFFDNCNLESLPNSIFKEMYDNQSEIQIFIYGNDFLVGDPKWFGTTQINMDKRINNKSLTIYCVTLLDECWDNYNWDFSAITNVTSYITVEDFKSNTFTGDVKVLDSQGHEVTAGIITSKMSVETYDGSFKADIWVKGDINADGELDITDMTAVCNVLIGSVTTEPYIIRSDVNNDGQRDITDMNAVRNIIMAG